MQPKYTGTKLQAMLSALVGAGEQFNDPKMVLFTNNITVTPEMALADLAQPTFTGYAVSSTVTWGTAHIDDDGRAKVHANPKEFKCTVAGEAQTVHHVGLVNQAGTVLLATYRLDTPLVFTNTSDVHLIGFPLVLSQPTAGNDNIVP